jgi:hypothetical protein
LPSGTCSYGLTGSCTNYEIRSTLPAESGVPRATQERRESGETESPSPPARHTRRTQVSNRAHEQTTPTHTHTHTHTRRDTERTRDSDAGWQSDLSLPRPTRGGTSPPHRPPDRETRRPTPTLLASRAHTRKRQHAHSTLSCVSNMWCAHAPLSLMSHGEDPPQAEHHGVLHCTSAPSCREPCHLLHLLCQLANGGREHLDLFTLSVHHLRDFRSGARARQTLAPAQR